MPIYEYECQSCRHHFDVMQKMTDNPIDLCPSCSKNDVIRLISQPNFQLRGNGWYVTDFKNKASTNKTDDNKPIKDDLSSHKKSNTEASNASNASNKKTDLASEAK